MISGNVFELVMTIAERGKAKLKCPTCKGMTVVPQFSGFVAQRGRIDYNRSNLKWIRNHAI